VGVGQVVAFAGSFTDNAGDVHTVTWGVDAISFAGTVNEGAFTTAGSYTFTAAGVYTVKMTVKDQCNQTSVATTVGGVNAMVVVYDPSAGFVTGGGWINSPLGAYSADPSLTGKANFGFVSKYKKGQSAPDGETEFQFNAGNLNFHSSIYEWLVISGARAQFKGSGTINDADMPPWSEAHVRVEPSTSVNKNVTVPDGGCGTTGTIRPSRPRRLGFCVRSRRASCRHSRLLRWSERPIAPMHR
jgi:hypothetical protein